MLSQWDQELCSEEALFTFNFTTQENGQNKCERFGSRKKIQYIYNLFILYVLTINTIMCPCLMVVVKLYKHVLKLDLNLTRANNGHV